jgi:hypothetical protein
MPWLQKAIEHRFNGEGKDGGMNVWRDAKHYTPEACAPFF